MKSIKAATLLLAAFAVLAVPLAQVQSHRMISSTTVRDIGAPPFPTGGGHDIGAPPFPTGGGH